MPLRRLKSRKEIWDAGSYTLETEASSHKRPKVLVKRDVFNLVLKEARCGALSGHQASTRTEE